MNKNRFFTSAYGHLQNRIWNEKQLSVKLCQGFIFQLKCPPGQVEKNSLLCLFRLVLIDIRMIQSFLKLAESSVILVVIFTRIVNPGFSLGSYFLRIFNPRPFRWERRGLNHRLWFFKQYHTWHINRMWYWGCVSWPCSILFLSCRYKNLVTRGTGNCLLRRGLIGANASPFGNCLVDYFELCSTYCKSGFLETHITTSSKYIWHIIYI